MTTIINFLCIALGTGICLAFGYTKGHLDGYVKGMIRGAEQADSAHSKGGAGGTLSS